MSPVWWRLSVERDLNRSLSVVNILAVSTHVDWIEWQDGPRSPKVVVVKYPQIVVRIPLEALVRGLALVALYDKGVL